MAYHYLGGAYHDLGKFRQAIEYYKRHLSIVKELRDRTKEGNAYGNLRRCHLSLGDFKKAIECGEQCLEIAKKVGDKSMEGNTHGCLGTIISAQ